PRKAASRRGGGQQCSVKPRGRIAPVPSPGAAFSVSAPRAEGSPRANGHAADAIPALHPLSFERRQISNGLRVQLRIGCLADFQRLAPRLVDLPLVGHDRLSSSASLLTGSPLAKS